MAATVAEVRAARRDEVRTHTEGERGGGQRKAPTTFGLPQKKRAELEQFFCAFEGEAGLRSTTGSVAERLAASRAAAEESGRRRRRAEIDRKRAAEDLGPGLISPDGAIRAASRGGPPILTIDDLITARPTSKGSPAAWDDVESRMVALVDSGSVRRAGVVRSALRQVHPRHLVVLYRVCGPRNGHAEHAVFGDLAPIADLTDAAETLRDHYALRLGVEREADVTATSAAALDALLEERAGWFWRAAQEEHDLRARAYVSEGRALLAETEAAERARLLARAERRRKEADLRRTEQGLALRAHEAAVRDGARGSLSARLSALASADREISAADALSRRLAEKPSATATKEARARHKAELASFVGDVAADAKKLWIAASLAYLAERGHA